LLKLCIIGLGNCGNQIAELAKKEKNIPGIAINSSEKDLTTINTVDKILIGDMMGSGKDRNEAKRFITQNIQLILQQEVFKKLIEESNVIFIASSTSGGTGSGMTPILTEILTKIYHGKRFVVIHVYPAISESVAAQQNSLDYLKELRQFIPNITYMAYDNHRRSNEPTDRMMTEINMQVVNDICVIRGDYQYSTQYSSIDEKDMLKLIETPGRLLITTVNGLKEKDLDEKSVEDILIFDIKNTSVAVEIERDRLIKRIGLITNLNDKIHKAFNTKLIIFKEFIGEPVEGFEHIHINKGPDESNQIIVIMSGLSVPDDRIQKMIQRIEEVRSELMKVQGSSILDSIKTEDIDILRENSGRFDPESQINLTDVMAKYLKR